MRTTKTLLLLIIALTATTLYAETLRWTNPSPEYAGITHHLVYYSTQGMNDEVSIEVQMPDLFYNLTVSNFTKGETYCFSVVAVNNIGASDRSVEICQQLWLERPDIPVDIIIN